MTEEVQRLLGDPTITVADYRKIMKRGLRQAYADVARGDVDHIRLNGVIRIVSAPLRKRLGLEPSAAA